MKTKQKLIAALKIWAVIYPSITIFHLLFGEMLAGMPLAIRTLILTAVLVPWMVFAGMPLLERALRIFTAGAGKNKD